MIAANDLDGRSPERGRFRAFLLAAMKHYMANEWDKARRRRRGGGAELLSLDCRFAEERYRIEPSHHLSPDRLYDRAWAMTLLERVVAKLESTHAGNPAFPKLKPCLTAGRDALDYAAVASELGMSEGAVRVAAHRMRRQYRELLRAEISETLDEPGEFGDELQALYRAFSG